MKTEKTIKAPSLFDLSDQYKALLEFGQSVDPEDQQTFLDTLEGLTGEIAIKLDAWVAVMIRLKATEELAIDQRDRLDAFIKTVHRNRDRMSDGILTAMDTMGVTELKSDLHSFRKARNGGKAPLIIDDPAGIPTSYQKVVIAPDTDKIREALEAGEQLPFAHLGERGVHLRVK